MTDCQKKAIARGWCRTHYNRWTRTGDPTGLRRVAAPMAVCAREGCENPVKAYQRKPRKYCSLECYRSSPKSRVVRPKVCNHCSTEYQPVSTNQRYCLECLGPAIKTPDGRIAYSGGPRLRIYGVSHPEWLAMVARFDGECWICRVAPATALDHCHSTGRPRGALCSRCNNRLQLLDKKQWFAAALRYIEEAKEAFA